jgi:hypothetical protein
VKSKDSPPSPKEDSKMSEEHKAFIRRWFREVWNNGRAEAIEEPERFHVKR